MKYHASATVIPSEIKDRTYRVSCSRWFRMAFGRLAQNTITAATNDDVPVWKNEINQMPNFTLFSIRHYQILTTSELFFICASESCEAYSICLTRRSPSIPVAFCFLAAILTLIQSESDRMQVALRQHEMQGRLAFHTLWIYFLKHHFRAYGVEHSSSFGGFCLQAQR